MSNLLNRFQSLQHTEVPANIKTQDHFAEKQTENSSDFLELPMYRPMFSPPTGSKQKLSGQQFLQKMLSDTSKTAAKPSSLHPKQRSTNANSKNVIRSHGKSQRLKRSDSSTKRAKARSARKSRKKTSVAKNSKYFGLYVKDLQMELKKRRLSTDGLKGDLINRLEENNRFKNVNWGLKPEGMGGWEAQEDNYTGPSIHETIRVGDWLRFSPTKVGRFMNIGQPIMSDQDWVEAEVCLVRPGNDGTGRNDSVSVNLFGVPRPIMAIEQVQRVKYTNSNGDICDVPNNEGAIGYLEDFALLVGGEKGFDNVNHLKQMGQELRGSLDNKLNTKFEECFSKGEFLHCFIIYLCGQTSAFDHSLSTATSDSTPLSVATHDKLRRDFVELISQPAFRNKWVAESTVRSHFGDDIFPRLSPITEELVQENRLMMEARPNNNKGELVLLYFFITK